MLEKNFQKLVIKELEKVGAYVVNVISTAGSRKGLPDLIFSYEGTFVGMELKVKHTLQEHQLLQLKKINNSGGIGVVFTHSKDWKTDLFSMLSMIARGLFPLVREAFPLPESEIDWDE